jgi:phage gp36-like protein
MYCTVDELRNERVTGEDFDWGTAEQAILDASDAIDMRLSGHYNTPFSNPAPKAIRRLCLDMACCFLLKSVKAMLAQDDSELASTKFVCDRAERELDRLASGKLDIGTGKKGDRRVLVYTGDSSYLAEE